MIQQITNQQCFINVIAVIGNLTSFLGNIIIFLGNNEKRKKKFPKNKEKKIPKYISPSEKIFVYKNLYFFNCLLDGEWFN
jgi:hypothetical protein